MRRTLVKAAEGGLSVAELDRFIETQYPKLTTGAMQEAAERGIKVGEPMALGFAADRVRTFGGSFAWRTFDIDALVAHAEKRPRVQKSRDLLDATDRGVSLACFLRLRDAQDTVARDAAAKACGVTFDEWLYCESIGGGGDVERGLRIANRIPNASDREYISGVVNTARGGEDFEFFIRHLAEVRARRLAMESECDRRGFVDDEVARP